MNDNEQIKDPEQFRSVATLKNESADQYSLFLERRNAYGQGNIETIVHFDQGVVLLEERSTGQSRFISLLSTQARERLKAFL